MMVLDVVKHVFFFFSSRRRHTRSLRDWSSDVCSSDLCRLLPAEAAQESASAVAPTTATDGGEAALPTEQAMPTERSEERRVGKECRSRWARGESKKRQVRNEDTDWA